MKEKEFGAEEIYLAPTKNNQSVSEDTKKELVSSDDVNTEETIKASFEVEEIPEMRKENKKVFRMSDGTEKAVFYPEALHVYDEKTKSFEKIDNSLVEEEDGRHFRNRKGNFTARFSKEEENDELFSIEKGGHKLTVFARKNKKQMNHGVIPDVRRKNHATVEAEEEKDVVCFAGAIDGSDLEYSITGNGIKEDIVVKEKAAVYRYPFVIETENLAANFQEGGRTVTFTDKESGKAVFFIPAPFMTDAKGAASTAVTYELKEIAEGKFAFTVIADSDWMNSEKRAFPITIDPQITVSGSGSMTTYSWDEGYLYSSSIHAIGGCPNGDGCCNANRMYLDFAMPTLPRNPRIKKAELTFTQYDAYSCDSSWPKIGLYHVTEDMSTGYCTPVYASDLIDFAKIKSGYGVSYTFDITTLVDKLNKGESSTPNLVLKLFDEANLTENYVQLYGSTGSSSHRPVISITYDSSYGVNTSYRTNSHELGGFGQGSIDVQCGNLMFESDDFAWSGNRMPVTIKHLYNSALSSYKYTKNTSIKLNAADFSAMNIGYGWKLNLMQSMISGTFVHEGTSYSGYIYTNENGEETYFKYKSAYTYEDVDGSEIIYNSSSRTMTLGGETYSFDTNGRLVSIADEYGNKMTLTYTSNRITSVTDGAGREFALTYNSSGFLTAITAPDNTSVTYTYSGNLLASVTYPDGKKAAIAYSYNKPASVILYGANGKAVYKVVYTFSGNRLYSVAEYGVNASGGYVLGVKSTYSYSAAARRTLVETTEPMDASEGETEDNVLKAVYTFDEDGNVIGEYMYSEDTGNVGVTCGEESGINPNVGSGYVSNVNNLLTGHNFETLTAWTSESSNASGTGISSVSSASDVKFGACAMKIATTSASSTKQGVYQTTTYLPAGEYTFSAYLKVASTFNGAGAYIRVTDTSGNVLSESEKLKTYDSEYIRVIAPFALTADKTVQVHILADGAGTVYVDGAQLENNPFVNDYNMLENGNFERGMSGWSKVGTVLASSDTRFNMAQSMKMVGYLDYARYAYQDIKVKSAASTRETFTLSAWAAGYGISDHERDGLNTPKFELRAVIYYTDGTTETVDPAKFSPCTEEWQFASVQFAKSKYAAVSKIRVYCDYSYNEGSAYFDDVQLIRDSIETGLTAADFEDPDTDTDTDTGAEDTASTFEEVMDAFGNTLTETTFADGELGTIYRSFKFNEDDNCMAGNDAGNNLVEETDARGNKTTYTVDGDTSRNEEITDRCGNKTAYEYDEAGRTTKVTSKNANGNIIAHVSYAYDAFNNMTEIVRGDGMKYALAYNDFHNLESIGVNGKSEKLIKYTYKNGNGRLKEMTYANGHKMKATYNSIGQMVAEKWYNSSNALVAHYKYVYDGQGNIIRSIDIQAKKEYNYIYDEGRLVRATENTITLNGEMVTGRTVVNTVRYKYNSDGQMTSKVITPASGSAFTYYFTYSDDNTSVQFTAGGRTVTSRSNTDSFGRKTFDEIQLGTNTLSRQFSYHEGQITEEHQENGKIKSSPTTQLVSRIVLSDGRTLSYEYDEEERITKVIDSFEGTTEYTYDALGQLLTEKVNGVLVNTMTYDNYGNILSKNGVAYTYGDSAWKDKLTAYNGQSITYDAQGNPVSYLGHTLTWEKGRQLKSFDNITYTYNANGIRTSKTVNGVKHTYTLDGTKILRETWGSNILIPLYDNEDTVCGIIYNSTPYYFLKNLQGDVIAITDATGAVVAEYSYDAWGKCTITADCCNIANVNPYRYRGYYYDVETKLYYLQSRYYDASVGRFINADDVSVLLFDLLPNSRNIFVYCVNEPVFKFDPYGYWVLTLGVSAGVALALGISVFATLLIDSTWDYGLFLGASLLVGVAVEGLSGSFGFYWGFNKIQNYLNSVTVGYAAGYTVGGTLVYDYYKYPSSKKKLVGIQVSYGTTGIYREFAPFDGGIYIPLRSKLRSILSDCGRNIFKLRNKIKKLKIKVYR